MLERYLPRDSAVQDRWDGKYLGWRIGCRLAGGLKSGLAILAASTNTPLGYIGATLLLSDGFGDLITRNHHYVASRLGRKITGNKNWPHPEKQIDSR